MNGLRLLAGLAVAASGFSTTGLVRAADPGAPDPAAPPDVPPAPAAAPAEPQPTTAPAPAINLAPPAGAKGKIDLTTPPPAASVPRSYHMHDGFYARASLGFGSLSSTFDDDDPSGESLKGSGGALSLDLMLGGSPAPGVAVGGALLAEGSAAVEFERGALKQDRTMSLFMVGPFIDGFFRANRGWHMGGMLALARLNIEKKTDGLSHTNGFGGAFWLGHDFWVADEWSVGPLLRFSGALTSDSDPSVHASTFAVTLLFTGLYH